MALKDYRADAMRCSRCAYCKWIPLDLIKSWRFSKGCPSIEFAQFHSYSAGGRLVTLLSLLDGRSEITEKVKDSVFKCNLCGSCDVTCKMCRYDMEPMEAMRELRFHLVEEGHTPPGAASIINGLHRELNMLGRPHQQRGDWASALGVKNLASDKAEHVFHAGCRYSFDSDLGDVARTSVRILQAAGLDIGILAEVETCCGGRAHAMGYRDELAVRSRSLLTSWQRAGVRAVITPCSDCYHTFKRLYPPESGSSIEVLHMVELLDRLLQSGQLKFTRPVPMAVTYHDPCHLGRQGEPYVAWNGKEKKIFGQAVCYEPPRPRYNGAFGVYDAPRNVLRAIPELRLVEMERSREASWCCGAGGGARENYPEFSKWTANERIEEALSTGAQALVTACPWCERNFLDATDNGKRMAIFDVMQLVEQAL